MSDSYESVFLLAFEAHKAGQLQAAEEGYRQVLAQHPRHADALHLKGLIHASRDELTEAGALIGQATEICECAMFWVSFCTVLLRQERCEDALVACRRGIDLTPDYVPAHFNLGIVLMRMDRLEEAARAFRRVLTLEPCNNDALNNLGIILQKMGRRVEAESAFRRAIGSARDYAHPHYNLGMLLLRAGRFGEAEQAFRDALDIEPGHADARNNLGSALFQQNRHAEAELAYREVLLRHRDFAAASWNLALLLLSQGRFIEGWQYAEARCSHFLPGARLPNPGYPQWRGEPLAGRSLVIWSEQGLGDVIQFARYASLLKAQGLRRLTMLCPTPMKALMETLDGVDEVVCDTSVVGPHDFWSFIMSLPLYVGTTIETIPARLPYLRPLSDRGRYWHDRLPARGFKVGVVWKGSRDHQHDAERSLPGLRSLVPLWSVPGVTFISLQKGQGEEELETWPAELPIVSAGASLNDLADTAALICHLDLVISVDTAVAHLAGALGKPCWVLLSKQWTDWRWMHDRTDSLWYPGVMKLYRQSIAGSWAEVIEGMATALNQRVRHAMASREIAGECISEFPF
ncbi:tetratricopeptide repeat protein [Burkholderia territorii]|uniref:tetratricopeptide repeat protein n=1 Tax=Burkholderia territorii TaxID=1503055 RepID=UPI0009BF73A0|nr:tetratricopeptide repeat protein [Burkholderia territorii]